MAVNVRPRPAPGIAREPQSRNRIDSSAPEKKIDFATQWWPGSHRSGWRYALESLRELHVPGGVLLDGFIEKKFAWGRDPGDALNDPRPYARPWIGFWHNPPSVPDGFNAARHAPEDILGSWLWRSSAPYCQGLFTLSAYLRRWLAARVPVPVCDLIHPTEIPTVRFSPERYLATEKKRIVQVGWWLRREQSLYELEVPSAEKVVLAPFPEPRNPGNEAAVRGRAGITHLPYLAGHAYDQLLSESIVFLDLYDSSANNTIVECIVRGTPVLVNPLPAVIEYLGTEYPLYYADLSEASRKAANHQLAVAAHHYLRQAPIQRQFSDHAFRQAFVESEIYRGLESPTVRTATRPAPPSPAAHSPARSPASAALHAASSSVTPDSPRVTIFSSIYGADDDLSQFMADLCGQTAFGECEVLLFDICASHRDPQTVRDVILAYQAAHRNIKYIPVDADPGLYQVWNRAIEISRAPFLTNANIDDRKAPDAIEQHLTTLQAGHDVDVVCAEMLVTTTPYQTWATNSAAATYFANVARNRSAASARMSSYCSIAPRTIAEFGIEDLFVHDAAGRPVDSQNIPHCMPMWRASLHRAYGMFNPQNFGSVADWEFWIRCASGGARFAILRKALGLYYLNPASHNRRTPKDEIKAGILAAHWRQWHG